MPSQMDCSGATHVGRKRQTNEDQFLIAELNKSLRIHQTSLALDHQTRLFGNSQGKMLLVADGMGGHEAGERASTLAVDAVATYALNTLRWYFRLDEQSDDDLRDDLKDAMEHCQAALVREMDAFPNRQGMGTTLTMAFVIWPRLYIVHVGDSRCYLLRDQQLHQLTRDHTLAQVAADADANSSISSPQTPPAAMQHILWNVIGGPNDSVTPEVSRASLQVGDTLLLCTDGLNRHLTDETIQTTLLSNDPADVLSQRLVALANDAGGDDNITAVVAKIQRSQRVSDAPDAVASEAHAVAMADTAPLENPAGNPERTDSRKTSVAKAAKEPR